MTQTDEIPEDVMQAARKACDLVGITPTSDMRAYAFHACACAIRAERAKSAERIHYAEGVADLAMKHRDEAEARFATAHAEGFRAGLEAADNAVGMCASLDENGYVCEKSAARKAIDALVPVEPSKDKAIRGLVEALKSLLLRDQRNTCTHEDTHRGGFLWEICDACGAKWADDEGGKPNWKDPVEWRNADSAITAAKAAGLPGTEDLS